MTVNIKQVIGPKFKSGGGGIASRFGNGTGNLMVPGSSTAHNMSSADFSFDNPGNSSVMSRNPDASFSSHNVSMMSDAHVTQNDV